MGCPGSGMATGGVYFEASFQDTYRRGSRSNLPDLARLDGTMVENGQSHGQSGRQLQVLFTFRSIFFRSISFLEAFFFDASQTRWTSHVLDVGSEPVQQGGLQRGQGHANHVVFLILECATCL